MNVSHIVTVGCSFTFCQGLDIYKGWPALLAKELNCPLVNLGVPGASNGTIHRKTYEYIYNNSLVTNGTPLVIIAWTQPWRKEAWFKIDSDNNYLNNYSIISFPNDKPTNYYEYALLENYDDEDFYRSGTINKLSLINLFFKFNIPYITTDGMPQDIDSSLMDDIKTKFPGFEANKHDDFYIGSLVEITRNIQTLPCGHWNEEGNRVVKEFIANGIKKLHPNLIYNNDKEFLTLNDYLKIDKYGQKFPQWTEFKL